MPSAGVPVEAQVAQPERAELAQRPPQDGQRARLSGSGQGTEAGDVGGADQARQIAGAQTGAGVVGDEGVVGHGASSFSQGSCRP